MTKTSFTARRSIAGLGIIAALSLTGCSALNYQATTHTYSASDGVMFDAEGIDLRHFMFIAQEEGDPARMVGLINNGSQSVAEVELTVDSFSVDYTLEPGEAINLENDAMVLVPSFPSSPGSMHEVGVNIYTVGENGETDEFSGTVNASVLDGTLSHYRSLLPGDFDPSSIEHLEHGPDTYGGGAAHHGEGETGH